MGGWEQGDERERTEGGGARKKSRVGGLAGEERWVTAAVPRQGSSFLLFPLKISSVELFASGESCDKVYRM